MPHPKMSTNTRPELKFFLYSDPEEAKKPDNKRLVRVHVARISHAKTRNARTQTSRIYPTRGEEECLQLRAPGSELDGLVINRALSTSMPSEIHSSPYPPGMFVVDPALSGPSHTTPLAWLPSEGPARALAQGLSQEEQFLLDHCKSQPPHEGLVTIHGLRQNSAQM